MEDNSGSSWGWKDYLSYGASVTKKKLNKLSSTTPSPKNNLTHFNPESLTDKERVSREVFSQKKRAKPTYTGPIFDQFLVVGLKDSGEKNPDILFKYPADAQNFPGIVGLCFPEAVDKRFLRRTTSQSSLYDLLVNEAQNHEANSFVFMLTNEIAEVHYGVCVRAEESLEHNPVFVLQNTSPEENKEGLPKVAEHDQLTREKKPERFSCLAAQKCYIFVTRYPFFHLHLEVLNGLLAMEHVFVMSHIQKLSIEESLKDTNQKNNQQRFLSARAVKIISSRVDSEEEFIAKFNKLDLTVADPSPSTAEIRAEAKKNIANATLDLLRRYREMVVPNPGQTIEFAVPFSQKGLQFTRTSIDEEEESMTDYGLPITFYLFTLKHFFLIYSAGLLEKKILVVCSNLRILSAVVLSFITLFKPFSWQSILIPIVPNHLTSLLDAPLPFILGLPRLPPKLPDDVIIVELDSGASVVTMNEAEVGEIPPIPKRKELESEFMKIHGELMKTYTKGQIPYKTTSKQLRLSKQIVSCCEKHLSSLFSTFPYFCIRDLTESSTPITIFIKDAFLNHASVKGDINWFTPFLDTQMFFQFQDEKLRKADALSKRQVSDMKGGAVK
eukprot:TRINITY_DN22364_c0_g1_i1.p1 TRINITY_DN22364_c0_g1~~TRINITY_DN22364_c0_g1_i1.p1  ORF type:complete len:611 (+),score=139.01 TRINITY_DN22364_c0_g1_i1:93-1925(+)